MTNRDGNWYATMPKNSIIIRTDEVRDDYYDGVFVWAIVDPDDSEFEEKEIAYCPTDDFTNGTNSEQLGFLEDQITYLPESATIVGVKSEEGKLFLHYYGLKKFSQLKKHRIILRKTGQEIGFPLEKLTYIGWGYLFIKQELAVYGFLVSE
jgi:hypothetical protein